MAYGDFKDPPKRTAFDGVLRDKVFNIAKTPKCKRGLVSMVYKCFDKKLLVVLLKVRLSQTSN